MNEFKCWMCGQVFTYEGEKYQDVFCPHCQVLNSIYDPSTYEPITGPQTVRECIEELNQQQEEEMKPPKRESKDFEKVAVGEMIPGVIETIAYEQEHKFKGFQGKEDTVQPAVRFKFMLDGYKYPHYSRWMKFSYGEKANLYKIFLSKLVENAQPDMDFDLDILRGMKIKTLWNENGDFQNLESIFPNQPKVKITDPLPTVEEEITAEDTQETEV